MDFVGSEAVYVGIVIFNVVILAVLREVGQLARILAFIESFQVVQRGQFRPDAGELGVLVGGVDVAVAQQVLVQGEQAEVLVDSCVGLPSVWAIVISGDA